MPEMTKEQENKFENLFGYFEDEMTEEEKQKSDHEAGYFPVYDENGEEIEDD